MANGTEDRIVGGVVAVMRKQHRDAERAMRRLADVIEGEFPLEEIEVVVVVRTEGWISVTSNYDEDKAGYRAVKEVMRDAIKSITGSK